MSKSKNSMNKNSRAYYDDEEEYESFDTRNHRKEKKINRALKLRDIDALMELEDDEEY